jgi:hypothetical protein
VHAQGPTAGPKKKPEAADFCLFARHAKPEGTSGTAPGEKKESSPGKHGIKNILFVFFI